VRITKDGREILSGAAYTRRKRQVWERDRGRCRKCWTLVSWDQFKREGVDHIAKRKMGGGFRDDRMENLQVLCRACHDRKDNGPKIIASPEIIALTTRYHSASISIVPQGTGKEC
jgi:hypothetical protein